MQLLAGAVKQSGLVRFVEHFARQYPDCHLKDLVVEEVFSNRRMSVNGVQVTNFGSDSFLGLDEDPRVREAVIRGVRKWGTHNGASRAFSCVKANEEAEARLAAWLGTEAVLIFPSVTLANMGAIPGLVGKQDLLIVDEHAHNSIQEAARLVKGSGGRVETFSHCDPYHLEEVLQANTDYRVALVAIDGVYSMSGEVPPLRQLNEVAMANRAVLYVDDAHATGVLGKQGRGTVLNALPNYDNVLVVGSLSKGFSCAGGFIGCTNEFHRLLKIRSNTYIFGGPVTPPYLEAICTVCDILTSAEYDVLCQRLQTNLQQFTSGARSLGLAVLGGDTPIVSILVGDEEDTLNTGHFLFQRGYYVQSVTFPAVPYHAGVLRVQINANHLPESIEGLLSELGKLHMTNPLPGPEHLGKLAA